MSRQSACPEDYATGNIDPPLKSDRPYARWSTIAIHEEIAFWLGCDVPVPSEIQAELAHRIKKEG